MNKRRFVWFILLLKKELKKPLLWIMCLLMVLCTWASFSLTLPDATRRNVLIFVENKVDNSFANILSKRLIEMSKNKESVFDFKEISSRKELEQEVIRGKAECGFIFDKELDKKIEKGKLSKAIVYVSSNYTVKGTVARETVSSCFFSMYGEVLLRQNYEELFEDGEDKETVIKGIQDRYRNLLVSDEVLSTTYKKIDRNGNETESFVNGFEAGHDSLVRFTIFICIAAYIFFLGAERYSSEVKGFINGLTKKESYIFEFIMIFAGIIPFLVTGLFLRVYFGDGQFVIQSIIEELSWTSINFMICFLTINIIKKVSAFYAVMPTFLLISSAMFVAWFA